MYVAWPFGEVFVSAINVGLQRNCGLELLDVSSSQFDTERKFTGVPFSRGSAQIRSLVGAGFQPALLRHTLLARYSLGHPPAAEDSSRCKRECDPTRFRCEFSRCE